MNASDITGSGPSPGFISTLGGNSTTTYTAQSIIELSICYTINASGGTLLLNSTAVATGSASAANGTNGVLPVFLIKGQSLVISTSGQASCAITAKNIRQF